MSGRWSLQGWAFRSWAFRTFSLAGAGYSTLPAGEHGGEGIWYAQSQSGLDYPLVKPSNDIRYMLADVLLSYTNPGDYGGEEFVTPFNLYWIAGFGSEPAEADDLPEPAHDRDVIIRDAVGATVFDSRAADISIREWTDWLSITRWLAPNGDVCEIVHHTKSAFADFPPARPYFTSFFPESAVLQDSTVYRIPRRVRSISALLSTLTDASIHLRNGYNMRIDTEVVTPVAGGRRTTVLTFNAEPKAGLGLYTDCPQGESTPIRTINSIAAGAGGQFLLAADDCYYARQPLRLLTTSPRTLLPQIQLMPGSVAEEDLPATDAGTTTASAGWPSSEEYAHLQLGNDCGACCDCEDYVEVAEAIAGQHTRYTVIAAAIMEARDTYHEARERWLQSASCLGGSLVRVVVQAQSCPAADIGVQVCNQTSDCLVDIEIVVDITTIPLGGVPSILAGYTFATAPSVLGKVQRVTTKRWSVDTEAIPDGLRVSTTLDQLNPGSTGSVRFRVSFENCGGATEDRTTPYQVVATATAFTNSELINSTPASASDTLNCPTVITAPETSCVEC